MEAIGHRIIIFQEPAPERSPLGIIIPESARQRSPFAKVISVGNKVDWIKDGDEILMGSATTEEFEDNGKKYGIININDIECKYANGLLVPFGNKMIIFQDDPDTMTNGGLHIPAIAQKSKRTGEVVMVGEGCDEIKKGDHVFFSKMSGKVIGFEGVYHTIVNEPDLQGKIVNKELIPLGRSVMIDQDDMEVLTKNKIIVNTRGTDIDKPNVGTIVKKGKHASIVELKQRVFFSMYAGRKLVWDGKDYILMLESEIITEVPKGAKVTGGETQDHNAISDSLENSDVNNVFDQEYGTDRGAKMDAAGDTLI